jgi:nucleoside-diphosphate-sugar epimerase
LNLLITGGCGFIGVNLVYYLFRNNDNHRVLVVDNLSVGKLEDLSLIGEFTKLRERRLEKLLLRK